MTVNAQETYSQRFEETAQAPRNRGALGREDAEEKGLALVEAKAKDTKLYLLIDPDEDRIFAARFFAYGGKVSLALGDTLCTMIRGLTVQEACSLLGADVERQLRDDPETPALPDSKKDALGKLEDLLKFVKDDYPAAKALALAGRLINKEEVKSASFQELSMAEQAWLSLSEAEQIEQLNLVLNEKVRPALMNDGGNVQILSVKEGEKVTIQYQGACGSCGSSLGATLSFIEQALRKEVYGQLMVVPNM
ncbi:MAG: iron-sulfur cluster assembly scaffold protein SufE [Nitrospinae bacterium CG11_big_fil_rev_8_21_14_0_20_56_8]|nr:MAG: iron-sulfur cluster assembly scaffold protein SufE [Nitrospinae bacterium CG11_big_fil_rev_8_21_14_0_20_56_8]